MSLSLSPHHQGYGKHRNLVQIINTESPGELLAKQGWTISWPQLFPFEAASGFFFPSIPDPACPLLPFPALFSGSVKSFLGNFVTTKREFHSANVPSSCARATASGTPNSADLTAPHQLLKSRKACCGKEVVADKRPKDLVKRNKRSTLAPQHLALTQE